MWGNNQYTLAEWERLLTSLVQLFIISAAKTFAGLSITIQIKIRVTLAQQLLRACKGADLTAAIHTATMNRLGAAGYSPRHSAAAGVPGGG
jgi:hypothetical protein